MDPPSPRLSEDRRPSIDEAVGALRSLHDGAGHLPRVVSFGDHAVPALEALLRGPTESVDQPRSLAADALGLIRGPAATHALVRALRDSTTRRLDPVLEQAEYVVANRIAENLDHSSDAEVVDALLDALASYPYPGCVKALARIGERRAVPLLAQRLGDDVTRDAAVEALRQFDPDLVQRVLVRIVADRAMENGLERSDRAWGRAAAVLLLGELGATDVELARALDDPQAEVREAGARALAVRGAVQARAVTEPSGWEEVDPAA